MNLLQTYIHNLRPVRRDSNPQAECRRPFLPLTAAYNALAHCIPRLLRLVRRFLLAAPQAIVPAFRIFIVLIRTIPRCLLSCILWMIAMTAVNFAIMRMLFCLWWRRAVVIALLQTLANTTPDALTSNPTAILQTVTSLYAILVTEVRLPVKSILGSPVDVFRLLIQISTHTRTTDFRFFSLTREGQTNWITRTGSSILDEIGVHRVHINNLCIPQLAYIFLSLCLRSDDYPEEPPVERVLQSIANNPITNRVLEFFNHRVVPFLQQDWVHRNMIFVTRSIIPCIRAWVRFLERQARRISTLPMHPVLLIFHSFLFLFFSIFLCKQLPIVPPMK